MIRKAVIPAAGFGTRFLPLTKAQPKEMLPIVDTPTIQFVVEEAVASGINDILMVIGKSKRAIEEHFDRNYELEEELRVKGKDDLLNQVQKISNMADIHFVWQKELNGLGDAVRHARKYVGNEPFALLLGDTVLESYSEIPVTRQLMDIYDQYEGSVVALERVIRTKVSHYGIIDGTEFAPDIYKVNDMVEKPTIAEAPSDFAVAGRYIFEPDIFDYLVEQEPGVNNEVQLTDAMRAMIGSRPMLGYKFDGKRHDLGDKLEFIKTNLHFALQSPELREDLVAFMKSSISKIEP
ncbi:UTP--glucose-1-phosphate uridylyltransferase GalU [bacterium]|nr:UTP--glucose-1-phosphate uridylyltransferase GalU [bacterium]MDA7619359.1 UTP--glucose-1-phosphate uridylyltransferase GalU [bacterium]